MDIRTIRFFKLPEAPMPMYVHTTGYNVQKQMNRPEGFSAFQLLFARGGQGRFRLSRGEEFDFGPMQYLVLPPDLPHEYYTTSSEPWEVGYVSFLGDKVEELLAHFGMELCRPHDLRDMCGIWSMLDELWKIGDANLAGAEWEAVRLYYGLLTDLNRLVLSGAERSPKPAPPEDRDSGRAVAEQAASYLNEHYNENISISNVASTFGYTQQYLNQLFRRNYGVSMHQYVQRIRLHKAIKYMKESESMTIKEVAGLIGMEPSYFIRHFRQATGMTPDKYRKHRAE
ncbi:AraC family transcriptional regulator [Paenibacillus sp. LHD-38]|uniref:helix-turn-helix transcriptional regulator n=1 Tax=Paenibacillus sp. LHD-38 TaxID=3072143 RepID=UPI00280E875C|nr:AraC family transcriptional regulator [Paenibacillus sp. LHD-38]MDQ8737160.1 AraC family transcriptional regulator [Paenibacillus sp. LHD-38]